MAANQIQQILDDRQITRYELMKRTGLSWSLVHKLAAAETIPPKTTWGTLKKIRDALNLECVDQLESND